MPDDWPSVCACVGACIAIASSAICRTDATASARPVSSFFVEPSQMQAKASAGLSAVRIEPLDRSLEAQLRARIDGKAKPLGSLGRLEDLAVELALIWHPLPPRTERAAVFVFAADHGLTAEGVSLYPSSVTRAMVATYLAGRAGVNALARASGVDVWVVDAGVDAEIPAHPELIDAKIRRGSRNALRESALTAEEVGDCLTRGAEI